MVLHKRINRTVLSFPKSGRTWVRLFFLFYFERIGKECNIIFTHRLTRAKGKRIVLLRNPHDVMVSSFMHYKYRQKLNKAKTLSEFIRHKRFGIKHFKQATDRWLSHKEQLVVYYEDLFNNIWKDMLTYFEIPINHQIISEVDARCSFDNLRKNINKLEQMSHGWRYAPISQHPESHKIRQGKVGGYINYMNEEDINYINGVIYK